MEHLSAAKGSSGIYCNLHLQLFGYDDKNDGECAKNTRISPKQYQVEIVFVMNKRCVYCELSY
jgi:hypothetical protein